MQLGQRAWMRAQQLGVVIAVEIARQPALDADLGRAERDGFAAFASSVSVEWK